MKSRHLNILDFLDRLQIEYLQAEFRRSIHHSPKQKAYWKRVMDAKRVKIEDISSRSALDNIFNSPMVLQEYREQVFPNPKSSAFKFELKVAEQRLYYSVGAPVKVEVEHGEWKTGKIEEVDFDNGLASVRIRGSKMPSKHLFSKIIRVF